MKQSVVPQIPVKVGRAEVLWYAGFPKGSAVPAGVEATLDALLRDIPRIIKPAAVYRLFRVSRPASDRIQLHDGPAFNGRGLAALLGESVYACLFVVTAGEGIGGAAKEAIARGRFTEGLLLDAAGSAAVESAADHVQGAVTREAPLAGGGRRQWTQRFSPGYCDWPLEDQAGVFAALDPSPVGVTLNEAFLMEPEKSVSAVFGISSADTEAFETHRRPPCRTCAIKTCRYRLTLAD